MKHKIVTSGQDTVVEFVGDITEESNQELQRIGEELGSLPKVVFDLSRITKINSLGVRAWVQFVRSFVQNHSVIFRECAPDVVNQVNMIPAFRGNALIESVLFEYACRNCRKSISVSVSCAAYNPDNGLPAPACPQCGAMTESKEEEEEYFVFLQRK